MALFPVNKVDLTCCVFRTAIVTDFGVVIIPAYLVKGLDFDAVMINDVSEKTYPGSAHHAKLLYMSITRAHHELVMFYRGNLSPLLEDPDPAEPPKPRQSFIDWLVTEGVISMSCHK